MQGIILVNHTFKGSVLDQNYVGVELQFSTVTERYSVNIEMRSYGKDKAQPSLKVRYKKGRFSRSEDESNSELLELALPLLEAKTYEAVEAVAVNIAKFFND